MPYFFFGGGGTENGTLIHRTPRIGALCRLESGFGGLLTILKVRDRKEEYD